MSTTVFGNGSGTTQAHRGAELAMVDPNGAVTIVQIPPDSTITVQTLRTAPDPTVIGSSLSLSDAMTDINTVLTTEGAV